ncbi:uncharacterized protein TRIADDRAFT_54008 [Trichoplax adhaerens]|uniref:BTB domain-containing protein n=1 Tax=Trichoplax adhaerens TaxID=10228 RepID=B3RQV1_TRIAD|nr:hypothetical protein TRIADDRAFT_54008 [Trichoplax adhaerens]EDV26229.1 hypothetical protein TRIADDRAFT_54008 [Trichoplax adhaerens]|eukprot:XP_002110225.1 hypothetical protein TRIADDRAFT_54008 [Trichoplax adhaerens]
MTNRHEPSYTDSLWSSNNCSDVIFQIAGNSIRAHTPILKARTPLFYDCYVKAATDKDYPIPIDNITVEQFNHFLRQVYLNDEACDIDQLEGEWLTGKVLTDKSDHENLVSNNDNCSNLIIDGYNITDAATSRLGKDLLNLFQDNLSDVTLIIDDVELKCHKCILCARSEYFNAMLSGSWTESNNNTIELHRVHPSAITALLYYIYGGIVELPSATDLTFLAPIADMYNLDGLKDVVSYTFMRDWCKFFDKVNNELTDNISRCLEIADTFGFEYLRESCMGWIIKNFNRVWCSKSFAKLPTEIQQDALKHMQELLALDSVTDILRGCDYLLVNMADGIKWTENIREITTTLQQSCLDFISARFRNLIHQLNFLSLFRGMGKSDKIVKNIFDNLAMQLTPDNVCSHFKAIEELRHQTKLEEWEEMDSITLIEDFHANLKRFINSNAGRVRTSPGWNSLSQKQQEELKQGLVIFENGGSRTSKIAIGKNNLAGNRSGNKSSIRSKNIAVTQQNHRLGQRGNNLNLMRPQRGTNHSNQGSSRLPVTATTSTAVNSIAGRSNNTMSQSRRVSNPCGWNSRSTRSTVDAKRDHYSSRTKATATVTVTCDASCLPKRNASKFNPTLQTRSGSIKLKQASLDSSKLQNLDVGHLDSKLNKNASKSANGTSRIPIRNKQTINYIGNVDNQRQGQVSRIPRNVALSRLSPSKCLLSRYPLFPSDSVKISSTIINHSNGGISASTVKMKTSSNPELAVTTYRPNMVSPDSMNEAKDPINSASVSTAVKNKLEMNISDAAMKLQITKNSEESSTENKQFFSEELSNSSMTIQPPVKAACSEENSYEDHTSLDISSDLCLELVADLNVRDFETPAQSLPDEIEKEITTTCTHSDEDVDINAMESSYDRASQELLDAFSEGNEQDPESRVYQNLQ